MIDSALVSRSYIVRVLGATLFLVTSALGCAEKANTSMETITVRLGAAVNTVIVRNSAGSSSGNRWEGMSYNSDQACQVGITLPSDKVYSSFSKALSMTQEDGKVDCVNVYPFKETLPFDKAVAKCDEIMADLEMQLALPHDKSMRKKVQAWKMPDVSVSSSVNIEPHVRLFVELRRTREGVDGWSASVVFGYFAKEEP
jgi:hypothetical protein